MIVSETIYKFDPQRILDDYNKIMRDHTLVERQLALHYAPEDSDKLYGCCGTFANLKEKNLTEKHYNKLNDFVIGTVFEEILETVGNTFRARFMRVNPKYCYSTHVDFGYRAHVAIITNPKCYFVYPDDQYIKHIPADGKVYLADVGRPHTYINSSFEDRVHLVFGL